METKTEKKTFLNDLPLSDYTVVLTSEGDRAVAEALFERLGERTTVALMGKEAYGAVIRIGAAYRNGHGSNDLNGYLINNYTDAAGNAFCIDASSPKAYAAALDDLFSRTKFSKSEDTVSISMPYETVYSVEIEKNKLPEHEYVHWRYVGEIRRKLADGVTYIEELYHNQDDLPGRVYTLIVDPEKNKLEMGSANDGFDYTLDTPEMRQTTEQHMRAAVKNGKNVVAGINADFFDIDDGYLLDDYHPFGLTIKEGKIISLGAFDCRPLCGPGRLLNDRGFFAVDKKGKPIIAMESEYKEEMDLEMAVGGVYILARDGKTNFHKHQHEIIHGGSGPRAISGFDDQGSYLLMVVDGAQPIHSNGASLLQSALLMHRHGASDSLMMDGGGSAGMVLRNVKNGEYLVADKPGAGWLRHIYNSILVVAKEH